MKNKIFFADLDSTIILNSTNPKYLDANRYVCVSRKYGNPAGFMTIENFKKLQEVSKIYTVIPITTRCLNSYLDVNLGFTPEYSMVDNGAILLNGREILVNWMNYSEVLSKASHEAFVDCRKYLISLGYFEKWGSPFVLDFSTKRKDLKNPDIYQEISNKINKSCDSPILKYCNEGIIKAYISGSLKSVIIVDNEMTKKKSIERFLNAIGSHGDIKIYVAGDSEPDHCMLEDYDNSYGLMNSPAKIKFSMSSKDFTKDPDNISSFTSFILDKLLEN